MFKKSPEESSSKPALHEKDQRLDLFRDVELGITVEFGRTDMNIRQLLGLRPGSVISLSKVQGEPVDVRANGNLVAHGEAVIVNEKFGVRVTQIVNPESLDIEDM